MNQFILKAARALVLCAALTLTTAAVAQMRVGAGKAVITPKEAIWMSGYASRKEPSNGKIHDLYAKAIAIEDSAGTKTVVLTSDLIGLSARLSKEVAGMAEAKFGIPRSNILLTASHTHCGPVIRDNLTTMYDLDAENARRTADYTNSLPGLFMQAITQAVDSLEPCTLHWVEGTADFAVNRRQYTQDRGVVLGINPIGPVDHDVPMLYATDTDGEVKAVLFGYACHNTTLSFQQLCGDYSGFAQYHIEDALPGATALFVSGCGGDANPNPRRTLMDAQDHGAELGDAVLAALKTSATRIDTPVRAVYEEIELEFSEPPTREELERQAQDSNGFIQRRADALLKKWDTEGQLSRTYPYPLQIIQFGNDLQISALAGEVVVDYALRIKHELGAEKQFVIGYANDVMAYIPSLRILREGGYEPETSMIYYGHYGPWAPSIEERIMDAVLRISTR